MRFASLRAPLIRRRLPIYARRMAVVRCGRGGLFETKWIPYVSFKAVRLGSRRWQRCPVHGRWEMIERVDPATLSRQEREQAARFPAGRLP